MKPILSTPISRRTFLPQATAAVAGTALFPLLRAAEAPVPRIRVGACVVNLDQALEAGLDGVEVGVGGAADRLEIADPAVRQRYKEQMKKTGLPISSLMMGLLNEFPLATDPRGPAWLAQSIDAARDLGVRVIP